VQWIGYVGVVAFGLAWIPQSIETIREKRCGANLGFLLLGALGSVSLTLYAWVRGDAVFMAINALTSVGALLNAYYKLRPGLP
jgi:MtN3 and saliva related transmembrane protein